MRLKKKKLFGILLSFVLVMGMLQGTSKTAHAEDLPEWVTDNTGFNENNVSWDSGTNTLTLTNDVVLNNGLFVGGDGNEITIDLNSHKIEITKNDSWTYANIQIKDGKKLSIKNGTIDSLFDTDRNYNDNTHIINFENVTITGEVYLGYAKCHASNCVFLNMIDPDGGEIDVTGGMGTRENYTFEGWYTDADFQTKYSGSGVFSGFDEKVWPKWTRNEESTSDDSTSGGSTDSGSSSSSGSSTSTSTSTTTPATVPYEKVRINTGFVKDITGVAEATAETNPFGTKIENNDNLTTLLSLTPDEVAQGVNVWLDIQDMSATVPQADKDLVQSASANFTVGLYLDINLFKKVGGNPATKITETNGAVKASILIPESLWKAGRTFEIIRVHDGVPTVISGTYDENSHVFTFETDKFSTYALAYNDSANSTQSTAPRTGDINHFGVWYLLLAVSLGGLGFLAYSKKRKVNK
ncbi:MAG: InlB B-repeat-containing protein [Pseudobutyrivibrio sp.]|nr:InlB B-repeat-containing protein [Pseudobutyrivibrio sp.]